MENALNENFDPEASLEDGLKIQWQNRYNYFLKYPLALLFLEMISRSGYHQRLYEIAIKNQNGFMANFRNNMEKFIRIRIDRHQIDQ